MNEVDIFSLRVWLCWLIQCVILNVMSNIKWAGKHNTLDENVNSSWSKGKWTTNNRVDRNISHLHWLVSHSSTNYIQPMLTFKLQKIVPHVDDLSSYCKCLFNRNCSNCLKTSCCFVLSLSVLSSFLIFRWIESLTMRSAMQNGRHLE